MKRLLTVGIVVGVCATSTLPVSAVDLYFRPGVGGTNPTSGGSYTWDTSSSVWYSAATGGTATTWDNNNPAVAIIVAGNQFDIRLDTDITLAGIGRRDPSQPLGTRVLITSADTSAPSTLTFQSGAIVNYNTTSTRYLRFENLKINGNFTVINGGTTLGTGLTFINSQITNKGTLHLNAETTADVLMDGGTLSVNVAASTGVSKLSGTGSIARTTAGANGVFKLNQNVNTTLTGRIGTVAFTKTGTGTFIMNGGGSHGSLSTIRVDGGAFYTDGALATNPSSDTPPTLSVAAGAKAGGTFTSNRVVTLEAATSVLSPGLATLDTNGDVENHAGTLVLANGITAAAGGTFDFYMDEGDGVGGLLNSRINITGGAVTLSGTKTVNLFGLNAGLLEDGVAYTLFSTDGATTLSEGWNTDWVLGANTTGLGIGSLGFVGNELQVVFIPEPGTNALIMGGVMGLLAFYSRRFAKR